MEGDHRRVLLLPAEAAAGLRLHDLDARVVERHPRDERPVDVVGALEAAMHGDPAVVPGQRDHRVVLDVQLLLVPHAVRALDHDVCARQGGIDIAARELVVGEHQRRLERVEDRREGRRAECHAALRLAQRLAVRGGDQRDRLRLVADLAADRDEDRLVRRDARDDVRARDVVRRDDDHAVPRERRVKLDGEQRGTGVAGPDRGAVPGARKHHVVGVERRAGELGGSLPTRRDRDPPGHVGRRGGRRPRRRLDRQAGGASIEVRQGCDPAPGGVKVGPA